MERKPLININEMYCENGEGINPAYNMLLSGNMIPVKERVINTVLQKNNLPIVIINLDNTSSYMASVRKQPDYVLGDNQSYDLFSSMSIRDACIYLQNVAYEKQNGDDQSVQIIRYLKFIEKLNNHLGLELHTLRDINTHFYQPDVIGKALTEMYRTGKISSKELERLNVSLLRGIKGQLIIDDLLVSTDYNLNCERGVGFSVNNLQNGQTAFLDLSVKNNSYTEKKNRNDVLYSVKEFNRKMIMLLNVGKEDYQLISDFIFSSEHLLYNHYHKRDTYTKKNRDGQDHVQLFLIKMNFDKFCKRNWNQDINTEYNAYTQCGCNRLVCTKYQILKWCY